MKATKIVRLFRLIFVLFFVLILCIKSGYCESIQENDQPILMPQILGEDFDVSIEDDTFLSYILYCETTGKEGYIDIYSGHYQPPVYDKILDFTCTDPSSPILVREDKQYFYLNRATGEPISQEKYTIETDDMEYRQGYALVGWYKNGHPFQQLIDRHGVPMAFQDDAYQPAYGLQCDGSRVVVYTADEAEEDDEDDVWLYGLCDSKGNTILKPQYAYIGEYFNGYAWFSADGDLYGFLDEDGHIAIEPAFSSPWDSEPVFRGNYSYVLTEDYTDVIIDRQGNIVYLFSETDD